MPHTDTATRKKYMADYRAKAKGTPKYKAQCAAFRNSPRVKAYKAAWNKTAVGKASYAAYSKSPTGKFSHYKANAKLRGISFEISFDQFMTFWQKPCTYCGEGVETIGLDRVDSNQGYTIANIVPCCSTCNRSKLELDMLHYVHHCAKVVQHFKMKHSRRLP